MKFVELDSKVIVQGNSGRFYEIHSSNPPSKACLKCYFLKWGGYKRKSAYCDNTTVTKEFNTSCNCLMRNDKYFKLLEGGL